ncbi:MAG TPA: hypothetical protein PLF15_02135 [bacterium]|nr:hypothetical protein [bacterium]
MHTRQGVVQLQAPASLAAFRNTGQSSLWAQDSGPHPRTPESSIPRHVVLLHAANPAATCLQLNISLSPPIYFLKILSGIKYMTADKATATKKNSGIKNGRQNLLSAKLSIKTRNFFIFILSSR